MAIISLDNKNEKNVYALFDMLERDSTLVFFCFCWSKLQRISSQISTPT